jgi:uncharacterized protein
MNIYQEMYDEVFEMLNTKLPAYLTYHSPQHTKRVIDRAEFISGQEQVTGRDLYLVRIAALYHDIGFIRNNHHHEEIGCEICTDHLTRHGFSEHEIDVVCGMIMATRIPQQPKTLLEKIVADADLEYLGTDQFYPISKTLYQEFRHYDPQLTLHRFNEIQANFLRKHRYHTDYCKTHREAQKQIHLREILDSLEA